MTRKRGTAFRAALIASLAVAFGVGSSALATTPPSDTAGGGGECPRDIAAAAAAETTVPQTTAAPATTAAAAAPATTAAAAPETTAAPGTTAPPATLPENVTELDADVTSNINSQPRDALQQGGTVRLSVGSLAENWNPAHPDGNDADFREVLDAMNYWPILSDAEGNFTPNPDFLLDVTQTDDPFTVTYTLNPEAVWHSGDPITWEDYRANWEATNGVNPDFQVVSTEGNNLITSVEQGADEFEVIVTFCEPYADWQGLFWQLSPAESVATPEAHNTGWIAGLDELNDWMTGPFEVGTYDAAGGFVELVPSDTWWGEEPLLDSIQFTVISGDAVAQAYANNEIDAMSIGSDPNGYALAFNTPGGEIRAAAGPNWRHVTLNSGPNGGLIQDQVVRQAIQMSLDRAAIGTSDLAGIPWPARPLGNHIFVENNEFYVDNSDPWGTYDPDAAMALLEENGWVADADGVREKDGERLTVRQTQFVGVPVQENEAQLIQSQLAEVGIEVEIVDKNQDEFSETLTSGDYEMITFGWIGTPFPFSGILQLYGNGSDSNFGYSNIPGINELINQVATTLDPVERARIANEIDLMLWEYGHTIPLYQSPELIATRSDLANYGAFGFIRPAGWANVGYM